MGHGPWQEQEPRGWGERGRSFWIFAMGLATSNASRIFWRAVFFALCARVPSSGREASIIYYITELVDRGLAAGRFAYTAYRAATSPARSPSGLLFPP